MFANAVSVANDCERRFRRRRKTGHVIYCTLGFRTLGENVSRNVYRVRLVQRSNHTGLEKKPVKMAVITTPLIFKKFTRRFRKCLSPGSGHRTSSVVVSEHRNSHALHSVGSVERD